MTDKLVFQILNKHLEQVQQKYEVGQIFGIFATEVGDKAIKSEAVVIPSFNTICTSFDCIDTTIGNDIKIIDVRRLLHATRDGFPELVTALSNDYVIVNPFYQHLFVKLYKKNKDKILAGVQSGVPAPELEVAIMKVCRLAWNETSGAVRFIKQLTDAEKLALQGIVKTIGDEGQLSQYKVASSVGVSRLTMTNLIMKMKFFQVAEVTYLGQGGTYIKIIDDTLLDGFGLVDYGGK